MTTIMVIIVADSSNNEEERNEGHQDENALAAAEADYEVNPDAGEAREDLLPRGFRRRFREEDSEDVTSQTFPLVERDVTPNSDMTNVTHSD